MLFLDVSWRTWLGAKDEVFVRPAMFCRDRGDDLSKAGPVLVLMAGEHGTLAIDLPIATQPRLCCAGRPRHGALIEVRHKPAINHDAP